MEQLIQNFTRDYNRAVEEYFEGKYTFFLRNIRPAIEWLCKLVIANLIGDEDKVSDIFEGKKKIKVDYSSKQCSLISISGNNKALQGRMIIDAVLNAFLFKRKDVLEARNNETLKGLKEEMDMYCQCLRRFYSVASNGSHSGDGNIDKSNATTFGPILSRFISFLVTNQLLTEKSCSCLSSLQSIQVVDQSEFDRTIAEINRLNKEKEIQLENALADIESLRAQSENEIKSAQEDSVLKESKIRELESIIEQLKTASNVQMQSHDAGFINPQNDKPVSDLYLPDEKIDFDQEDIIMASLDESLLVSGCAGSGKSVIAMKKAAQLHKGGLDVITIAYTKSLNDYMQSGVAQNLGKFYYHHQWVKNGYPRADYIIVDEIQDFTAKEINQFIHAANKNFFFFGDSAQSIYAPFRRGILDMSGIAELTGLEPMKLYTNYRLPRPVAKITQEYVGIGVEPYSDKVYKNDSANELPRIIGFESKEAQVVSIAELIQANNGKSIGIFLPDNASVLEFSNLLSELDIDFEFKYELKKASGQKFGYEPYNTLNFGNRLPKVMTYHSAKGLQFDVVILPWYKGSATTDERKALYVAMTRTCGKLVITYNGMLTAPLSEVPEILYINRM